MKTLKTIESPGTMGIPVASHPFERKYLEQMSFSVKKGLLVGG